MDMDTLTLARSFASLLLDTAAKGTALLLLACLAAWLCRRSSAALRHSIWCLTMGGLLLLPIAAWALPAWQIPILPTTPAPTPVAEVVRLPASVTEPVALPASPPRIEPAPQYQPEQPIAPSMRQPIEPVVVVPLPVERKPMPAPAIVQPAAPPLTNFEWTSLLVSTTWSFGVALFGVLLFVGLWRTIKLRRSSLTVSDGDWPLLLVELRLRLGLARSVELREHAQSVVPLTWGIWRPVVLLPKLARAWDEPMRRAVLLHELAHVQRGDVACQVLGRLTCVLYWFHPLAWFALRQLRQEREQACDDAVVQSGEKASDYAEQLLQVARLCCAPRGLSFGVAMAEGSSLERRVVSLFDSARSHGRVSRANARLLFIFSGLSIGLIASIQPVSVAGDKTPDVPPSIPTELDGTQQRHSSVGIVDAPNTPPEHGRADALPPAPADAQPAFTEFVVNIQPFEAPRNGYIEQLTFKADGKCWYKVEGREADANLPARTGAVFDHQMSPERIRQLNQLLSDTKWLTADDGAKGSPPRLHATTYQLTLKREGGEKTIVWAERGPEPYRSLLHYLEGIAAQERRVYLHDTLSGEAGREAWQEIGRELAALRGEPYGKSPYEIDYARYLPIAVRIVRDFHGEPDVELVTAVRLIGQLKAKSELEFIHRMAQDRSSNLRREVAWTLGEIHAPESLPVLLGMMSAAGTRWEVGFDLIQWGDDAVPGIVKLIELSTKDGLAEREHVTGEDMIRAYLQNWDKVPQPIHADVITAVKQALDAADPMKSVRTTYHKEFLQKVGPPQVKKDVKAIPQVRPQGPVAVNPVADTTTDTKRDLLQRLVRGGKISSDSLNAMITLVSSEGVYDQEFISVVLAEFDKSCEPDSTSSKRNLLAVLTKMLEIHGSFRWQAAEPGPDSLQQVVLPDPQVLSKLSSEILGHLITQGRKADRSDIDAFVMALRQAHHANGKEFLRDVLRNPEGNTSPFENPQAVPAGKWADNLGGTWTDAKFHAAVALAELGDSEGVEWLIKSGRPNDFGLGAGLFHRQHSRDPSGFMQVSCQQSLIDLFGLKHSAEFTELEAWWKTHKEPFRARPVALGRPLQPQPQPTGQAAPALPDVRWEGSEVTEEQIAKLAGKSWGTVTLIKEKYNGAIIEGLRHATSIRTLRLYGNDLAGQTARLRHIAGLTELEIGTPLMARDMEVIGQLTDLTSLSLPQELTLNDLGAREIARLVNLRSLKLYLVNIDDTAFAELRTITKLEELDLSHTQITDAGLSVLVNMPQLRTLELDRFHFTPQRLTDACLPVVCQLQKLEQLSLSGEISNEGLKQVARLPNLKSLWILHSQITGEGLAALEHSTVESLLLSPGQVGEAGLANLKKCKTLKLIQVNGQFNGLEEIEQWQQALPDVGWTFIDP